MVALEGAVDNDVEGIEIDGLLEIVKGALPHGIDGARDAAVGGDQHHLGVGVALARRFQDRHAIHTRHAEVGEDEIDDLFVEYGETGAAGVGHVDLKAALAQVAGQGLTLRGFIIDDEQCLAALDLTALGVVVVHASVPGVRGR